MAARLFLALNMAMPGTLYAYAVQAVAQPARRAQCHRQGAADAQPHDVSAHKGHVAR